MFLTFLESDVPLTKTYALNVDGTITKSAYPNVWQVTTHSSACPDLQTFEILLNTHAKHGHCLLKGSPTRQLVRESRAGTTDRSAATDFICLDLDGIPAAKATQAEVDNILSELGLRDVSYLLQWSGSQNITSTDIRCHIFIMLSAPMAAPMIKQWLIQKNFEVSRLHDCQRLTKTNMSLTWALDTTACQSDKLIYIAPPVLVGIKPALGRMPRVQVIMKDKLTYDLHAQKINSVAQNRELTDKRVVELRDLAALPKRKLTYKQSGSFEVLAKPDEAVITDIKHDRGFVYFNFNGGDSWAYYHPEDRPEHIFNFKGEPVYLTKELLPDYWNSLKSAPTRVSSTGIQFLAFLDKRSSTYFRGTYDPVTDALQLHTAKNETQIRHFCSQYGLLQDDFIPEWTVAFDPQDSVRVDTGNQDINTFERTKYMKAEKLRKVKACPPGIFALISHVMGNDVDCVERFINWLAFIIQKRERAQTAWIIQGTEGTGKGLLFREVLRPLFGARQTNQIRAAQLQEKYNPFMKNCLLLFVDEVEAKMFDHDPVGMANLKNYITEETIQIRNMYQSAVEERNYCSIIMASNKSEPLPLPPEDRRHNVAPRQDTMWKPTDADIAQLGIELQDFHDYLALYPMDEALARSTIRNDARTTLIGLSQTTVESTAAALKNGDFLEFLNQLPTNVAGMLDFKEQARISSYRSTLSSIIDRTNQQTGACTVTRDELQTMFSYSSGEMPKTPAKFTKLLGHKQIDIYPVRLNGKTVQGTKVVWQDFPVFAAYRTEHFTDIPVATATPTQATP